MNIMTIQYFSDDASYNLHTGDVISDAHFCADQQEIYEEAHGELPEDFFDEIYPTLLKAHLVNLGVTHVIDEESETPDAPILLSSWPGVIPSSQRE